MSRPRNMRILALLLGVQLTLALGACGETREAAPTLTASQVTPDMTGADPRLTALVDEADELLDGGRTAFEARLKELRGLPVVVNKWASWCPPCKAEAPYLQRAARKYANRVAFLGIDVQDSVEESEQFRKKYPMPYPSYDDPEYKISVLLPPADKQPVTGFWSADGKLVAQKYGEYTSLAELESDIRRHLAPPPTPDGT